jgi:hypothetical protein
MDGHSFLQGRVGPHRPAVAVGVVGVFTGGLVGDGGRTPALVELIAARICRPCPAFFQTAFFQTVFIETVVVFGNS